MGTTHSKAYSLIPNAKVVGVADLELERATRLAQSCQCPSYDSIQGLLKNPNVQLIDVTLPTPLHCDAVVQAAEGGKHVICEKPIALTLADADRMLRAARKNKVELMVAHVIRFWQEWAFLADKVKTKDFGGVKAISCLRLSEEPKWGWKGWLLDGKKSGGAIVDLHIHDTDFICHLLGRPKAVTSIGDPNHILTIYDYGRNLMALAEGGWFHLKGYPFVMAYECYLERATFKYSSDRTPTLTIFQPENEPYSPEFLSVGKDSGGSVGNIAELGGYYEELKYFIGCIDAGKKPDRIKPQDARQSLEICLAEFKSLRTGRKVPL